MLVRLNTVKRTMKKKTIKQELKEHKEFLKFLVTKDPDRNFFFTIVNVFVWGGVLLLNFG